MNLLSTASKFGSPKKVTAFNLPLEHTCCAPGSGIGLELQTDRGHRYLFVVPSETLTATNTKGIN